MKYSIVSERVVPNVLMHRYDIWKARIRIQIKRAMYRGMFDQTPEAIAKWLSMDKYQIFYARTLTKFVKIVEEAPRDEALDDKWLDGAPVINEWWRIFERQEKEGWWVGQMHLPL